MFLIFIQRLFLYVRFYFKADTIYKVHSPYLFELIRFVFDKDRLYYDFDKIFQASEYLKSIQETIPENEFTVHHRQQGLRIADMYLKTGHPLTAYESLYRLRYFIQSKNSLELGASVGLSGLSLALANKKGQHTSVEGNFTLVELSNQLYKQFEVINGKCIHSTFKEFLSLRTLSNLDLIFIDGDHQYQATIENFLLLLPTTQDDTVIVLDDIHWSAAMYKAWIELSKHPEIHCSLETLRWGILFRSKKLTKGQFSYVDAWLKPWQRFI